MKIATLQAFCKAESNNDEFAYFLFVHLKNGKQLEDMKVKEFLADAVVVMDDDDCCMLVGEDVISHVEILIQ